MTAYAEYLLSPEWRARREAALSAAGRRCVRCGRPARQVHHVTYRNIGNEPPVDLVALCAGCHAAAHGLGPSRFASPPVVAHGRVLAGGRCRDSRMAPKVEARAAGSAQDERKRA